MEDFDQKKLTSENKSSHYPEKDEEDDFFARFDRKQGITDEQLRQKELEKTGMINLDQEVTKALQTLSKDDQEVFERTGMIHFDRTAPIETQVMKAVKLQKQNEAHRKRVFKTILLLMIIGIGISLLGIFASAYFKNQSSAKATANANPLAVDPNEEDVKINDASFPDASFRDYIKQNADHNGDGQLSPDERNAVLMINLIGDPQLSNVKGIELFPLLQAVNLSSTALTDIDLSSNTLLENINLSGTKVVTLDLSKNIELTKVNISNTAITILTLPAPSKIEEINVTNTTLNCTKDDDNYYNACAVKQ